MMFYKTNNLIQNTLEFVRKYIYFFLPLPSIVAYLIYKDLIFDNIVSNENYLSNIVNLSGVLAGFMLTVYSTFMTSLPDNKFIKALKYNGYLSSIYKVLWSGVLLFIVSLVVGILNLSIQLATLLFLAGISEVLGCLYYFYFILKYSNMST